MTCEELDAAMPEKMRKHWRTVAKLPLWWAWLPQLGTEIEQRLFVESGFSNPIPTFYRLFTLDGEEIFVQQMLSSEPPEWRSKDIVSAENE